MVGNAAGRAKKTGTLSTMACNGRRRVAAPAPRAVGGSPGAQRGRKLRRRNGVSASGAGDIERYHYVTGLDFNWMDHTVTVEAEDLQWLVGQCFLIADDDDIPELEADASDWQQMFGYIGSCVTDAMPSGRPLKRICSCGTEEE